MQQPGTQAHTLALMKKKLFLVQREYTGSQPHTIGIIPRSAKKAQEVNRVLQKWRDEEKKRKEYQKYADEHMKEEAKYLWEKRTTGYVREGKLRRQEAEVLSQQKRNTADRQQKLIALLAKEESDLLDEFPIETSQDRREKDKERVAFLKEKRKKEHQEYVEEKRSQQLRETSEDLRTISSRRHQDEVCHDRMEQLAIKAEMKRIEQENNRIYDDLWEKDRLEKAKREEEEMKKRNEQKLHMSEVLRSQLSSIEARREEERQFQQEESRMAMEFMMNRKDDNKKALEHKTNMKRAQMKILDETMRIKTERLRKEEEEQKALDTKLLQKEMEDQKSDAQDQIRRKQQRKEAELKYMQYLKEQRELEKIHDRDFERLIEEDVASIWDKRAQKVRLEKEARRSLLLEVLRGRGDQIQTLHDQIAEEREELKRDREINMKAAKEQLKIEQEREAMTKMINRQHETDLLKQIKHMETLKVAEKKEKQLEFESTRKAEDNYQKMLQHTLSNPEAYRKIHPRRRNLHPLGSSSIEHGAD